MMKAATIFYVIDMAFLVYGLIVVASYLGLAWISRIAFRNYYNENTTTDYVTIVRSELAPMVSLIAPAYNESLTIEENVKSLLALYYNNFEVIVVNDGSTDDSLQKLIAAFGLQKVEAPAKGQLKTANIKGIYKSTHRTFRKLLVVDKENGGKADALNAGINISRAELVACIDVDCILDPWAILKLAKPFLADPNTIATGGVIRVLNTSNVENGRLIKVKQSGNLLSRFQILEYTRAFLLGRMAWGRLNGLLIISGALGMFKKEIVIKAGGYDPQCVGEDMELVVRMRKFMQKQGKAYQVKYIPDPLCWTEVPSSLGVLGSQRNRWTRGTIETILKHRDILFNRKYGLMGLLSFPYWVLFEWFAPLLQIIGLIVILLSAASGTVTWTHFISITLFIYAFALFLSALALTAEEKVNFDYTRKTDLLKMVLTALLEPIIYRPLLVWWSLRGNIDLIKGKKIWGEMTRKGF